MQCVSMQFNSMQFNATQCNSMQFNAMQFNAIQCNSMQFNAMQFNATQCNVFQCNSIQCNSMQHYAMCFNAIQFNAMGSWQRLPRMWSALAMKTRHRHQVQRVASNEHLITIFDTLVSLVSTAELVSNSFELRIFEACKLVIWDCLHKYAKSGPQTFAPLRLQTSCPGPPFLASLPPVSCPPPNLCCPQRRMHPPHMSRWLLPAGPLKDKT